MCKCSSPAKAKTLELEFWSEGFLLIRNTACPYRCALLNKKCWQDLRQTTHQYRCKGLYFGTDKRLTKLFILRRPFVYSFRHSSCERLTANDPTANPQQVLVLEVSTPRNATERPKWQNYSQEIAPVSCTRERADSLGWNKHLICQNELARKHHRPKKCDTKTRQCNKGHPKLICSLMNSCKESWRTFCKQIGWYTEDASRRGENESFIGVFCCSLPKDHLKLNSQGGCPSELEFLYSNPEVQIWNLVLSSTVHCFSFWFSSWPTCNFVRVFVDSNIFSSLMGSLFPVFFLSLLKAGWLDCSDSSKKFQHGSLKGFWRSKFFGSECAEAPFVPGLILQCWDIIIAQTFSWHQKVL